MSAPLRYAFEQASTGDPKALEELLVQLLPGLRAYLGRHAGQLVGQKETPEDLAQSVCREVLERICTQRIEYQGEAQFRQWLYQAALHKLQNRHRYYRADRRDAAREVGPDPDVGESQWQALFASLSTPSGQAMRGEDLARLQRALGLLTEPQREIIRLARLEGLPHGELAQRLGVTESHSRVLLARAMARLARLAQVDPEA
ncbi:MAG: sigma-70 family RNA polymerase sigma factor [Planctomycetota bacterium]